MRSLSRRAHRSFVRIRHSIARSTTRSRRFWSRWGSRPAAAEVERRRTRRDAITRFYALLAAIPTISYREGTNWSVAHSDAAAARSSSTDRSCWRGRPRCPSCPESAMSRMPQSHRSTGEQPSKSVSPPSCALNPSGSSGLIRSASGHATWSDRCIAAGLGRRRASVGRVCAGRPPWALHQAPHAGHRSPSRNRLELGSWNSETIGYNESVRPGRTSGSPLSHSFSRN